MSFIYINKYKFLKNRFTFVEVLIGIFNKIFKKNNIKIILIF